ncbi:sensor histidine kinase [Neotamlana laminarinivorans]|uniref:Histidine kinase n=1 Tax=Neotamlana laminarinivorans TaxID=2883124 RepID=A0A9X1I2C0_9FLAO|nr:histidine kinase [Tamlana laminarinivorans]MCB4798947.1 histidine kinase [Tamlana laminarinivorans]
MLKIVVSFFKKHSKELLFQVVILCVLFIFYTYTQRVGIHEDTFLNKIIPYEIVFFANYIIGAYVISYFLIPRLYTKNKFFKLFLSLLILLSIIILIDEFVLEKLYFPTTRGTYFPGIIFTLVETLPVILLFVGFKFAWDYNEKQREVEVLKSLVQESELQFLKSQINPHFLFNNLNNLYAYAIESSNKTPKIILELSSVLRYMLYDCKENFVLLEKEILHLKNFTELYKLQIEHRGIINFKADNLPNNFTIAPLILMVFIENAFKHSIASQTEDIEIWVTINVDHTGALKFSCKNRFSAITNTNNLAKGIGLVNVKKRLELLYKNNYKLNITTTNNLYDVELVMKLNPAI